MEIKAQHEIFMERFLEHGDCRLAAEQAGFDKNNGRKMFNKMRERIQGMLDDEMAMAQVKAMVVLKDSMGPNATAAKQDIRLKAAESVLDRAGLGKKQTLEIGGSALPAVMILPSKDPTPQSKV